MLCVVWIKGTERRNKAKAAAVFPRSKSVVDVRIYQVCAGKGRRD